MMINVNNKRFPNAEDGQAEQMVHRASVGGEGKAIGGERGRRAEESSNAATTRLLRDPARHTWQQHTGKGGEAQWGIRGRFWGAPFWNAFHSIPFNSILNSFLLSLCSCSSFVNILYYIILLYILAGQNVPTPPSMGIGLLQEQGIFVSLSWAQLFRQTAP